MNIMKPHLNVLSQGLNFMKPRLNFMKQTLNFIKVSFNFIKHALNVPNRPRTAVARTRQTVTSYQKSSPEAPGEFGVFGVCAVLMPFGL